MDNNMLGMTKCCKCGGHFVTEPYEIARNFTCGLCVPPARAGKGASVGSLRLERTTPAQPVQQATVSPTVLQSKVAGLGKDLWSL
jgi:hypothetical protein